MGRHRMESWVARRGRKGLANQQQGEIEPQGRPCLYAYLSVEHGTWNVRRHRCFGVSLQHDGGLLPRRMSSPADERRDW